MKVFIVIMTLALAIAFPLYAQISEFVVQMDVQQVWTEAQIDIQAGDKVIIEAAGALCIDTSQTDNPQYWRYNFNGDANLETGYPASLASFCLMFKVNNGETKLLGNHNSVEFTGTGSGQLYIGINDWQTSDNGGYIAVQIIRLRNLNYGEQLVQVDPGQLWTNTHIYINRTIDLVTVWACGVVQIATGGPEWWRFGLTGAVPEPNYPFPNIGSFTLCYKIGEGPVNPYCEFLHFTPQQYGPLRFGYNDVICSDNNGLIAVRVGAASRQTLTPGFYSLGQYQIPSVETAGINSLSDNIPASIAITNVFPNPSNSSVRIDYTLQNSQQINITIYDNLGKIVTRLQDSWTVSGDHLLIWDGKNGRGEQVSSGVYFCRLQGISSTDSKQFIILK